MSIGQAIRFETGLVRGEHIQGLPTSDVLGIFDSLEARLVDPGARTLFAGRNLTAVIPVQVAGVTRLWAVKRFPVSGRAMSRGNKAWKSWDASLFLAERSVPVPPPIAIVESASTAGASPTYFITEFLPERYTFHDELVRIYRDGLECGALMQLLELVARQIRRMHDAGFIHNDLGNQNILLTRKGQDEWDGLAFIDLNRGRIRPALSDRDRARDLSRITLPSDFLRVFFDMYWQQVPPASFMKWEKYNRRAFAIHTATRCFRHPIREARIRKQNAASGVQTYPSDKDIWVWDSRSGQAVAALRSRDRGRYYGLARSLIPLWATLTAAPGLVGHYRRQMATAFAKPVTMAGRLGISVDVLGTDLDDQIDLLARLRGTSSTPVLLRFYHHAGAEGVNRGAAAVRRLKESGYNVSIALVQDRTAVLKPQSWREFVINVLAQVGELVDQVEIAHAINRVKWGIWSFREYESIARIAHEECRHYPSVKIVGPATIDFEYPFLLGALARTRGLRWDSLSHHLYVDRRGAPEGRQAGFSLLEKCALAKAIALNSGCIESGRVIVSEVNWPILGTGVWSPVNSPYESPGIRQNDPSVTEDEYASYLIRYLLIALCSGFVDQVFWWRLVARGYGLVDDTVTPWRPRPAFDALRYWLEQVHAAEFKPDRSAPRADESGLCVYRFGKPDGSWVQVCYSTSDRPCVMPMPVGTSEIRDRSGRPIATDSGNGTLSIGGSPVYLSGRG